MLQYEALGRPTLLSPQNLRLIEEAYVNNISAPEVAKHIGVSRQVIYYHYKKLELQKTTKVKRPSLVELLCNSTTSNANNTTDNRVEA